RTAAFRARNELQVLCLINRLFYEVILVKAGQFKTSCLLPSHLLDVLCLLQYSGSAESVPLARDLFMIRDSYR
ncbi:hypothetical protein EVAR_73985_1, partial [Eumeta japonica]